MDGHYYKIMEATSLSSLLEKVLSGRPGDPQKHLELSKQLFGKLSTASQANLRAVGITLSQMREQKRLGQDDFNNFSTYIKQLMAGKVSTPPNLFHVTFTNHPSSQKAAKLFHAMQTIQLKRLSLLGTSFRSIKTQENRSHLEEIKDMHKLEVKRLQCKKMLAQLKGALGINMEKTVRVWKCNGMLPDNEQSVYGDDDYALKYKRKTLNQYERRHKMYPAITEFINSGTIRFEQTGFWRWKLKVKAQIDKENRLRDACKAAEICIRKKLVQSAFET